MTLMLRGTALTWRTKAAPLGACDGSGALHGRGGDRDGNAGRHLCDAVVVDWAPLWSIGIRFSGQLALKNPLRQSGHIGGVNAEPSALNSQLSSGTAASLHSLVMSSSSSSTSSSAHDSSASEDSPLSVFSEEPSVELDEGEPRQPTTDHLTDSGNDVSSDGPSSEDDAVDDSEPNQGPQARRGQSNAYAHIALPSPLRFRR